MHKRLLIILTTITLSTALLVGCGNKQEEIPQATTEEIAPEQTEEETTPPTEIAEPTPEATTEPVEEATAEPVEEATAEPETTEPMETVEPEPTEEPTPEPTEEPTPEPQAIYTYTDMSATMYAQQTVNVRDLPDTTGNKVGSLSTNDEITISGQCTETGWYMFEYNGSVAFVSNKYVGENKVEIQQAPADNSTAGTGSTASNWADSYPKNQWIDMGEYYFYIANSQEEAVQKCCYDFTHSIREILEPRYPDRKVYEAAWATQNGNVPVCVVSTEANCDWRDPSWFRPKFIWE